MMSRGNHALWFGPVLTFAAAVTYFTTFARFAVLRDFPWVNLPLVLAGLALSLVGARRALSRGTGRWTKVAGLAGGSAAALLAGLFCLYVFGLSYALPPPTATTLALSTAPDFTLLDQQGQPVRLSEFRGRKVVLTFYRGFW